MENESEMKPRKAIRTLALTPKGKRAVAEMPKLTWDEVLERSNAMGSKPTKR